MTLFEARDLSNDPRLFVFVLVKVNAKGWGIADHFIGQVLCNEKHMVRIWLENGDTRTFYRSDFAEWHPLRDD